MSQQKRNYLVRHWRGQLRLPVSYWVNGVLVNMAVAGVAYAIGFLVARLHTDYASLIYWCVVIALVNVVFLWQSVGIWRSASNYQKGGGRVFWCALAKLAVILGAVHLATGYKLLFIPALKDSLDHATWLSHVTWEIEVAEDGTELEVRGGIKNGIANALQNALSQHPNVQVVHVNLYQGGLVSEARAMQRVIRARGLSTYVSGECVSACTLVFLGGVERLLKTYGRLGFHAYSVPGVEADDPFFQQYQQELIDLGIAEDFVIRIFSTPTTEMWWPSMAELQASKVVTEVVDGKGFSMAGTSQDPATKRLESIDRSLQEVETAETVRESLERLEKMNEEARTHDDRLRQLAQSAASKQFIAAHEQQNDLAKKAQGFMAEIAEIESRLITLNLENPTEADLRALNRELEAICHITVEYIPIIQGIVEALDAKLSLADNPDVFEEILLGDPRIKPAIQKLRDNQARVLEGERDAFEDLACKARLAGRPIDNLKSVPGVPGL